MSRWRERAWVGDRGSGTVAGLVVVAVMVVLAAWLALLVQAQAGRGRAQTAADLAALAGAVEARNGSGAECVVATEVVVRNHAELTECALEGGGVLRVGAVVSTVVGDASATARAGPARERG